jgi:hypothetical protein
MDWQQLVALAIVAITAGLLLWRWLRPRKRFSGRAGSCCCAPASSPQGSIVFRARKGERRQIIIKNP